MKLNNSYYKRKSKLIKVLMSSIFLSVKVYFTRKYFSFVIFSWLNLFLEPEKKSKGHIHEMKKLSPEQPAYPLLSLTSIIEFNGKVSFAIDYGD